MLTPQDIQKQKFSTKFRGFDVDEVDSFLEEVAESMLALIQENKRLKEQATILEAREVSQKNEEQTFKAAMIAAQKVAQEMKDRAREEASNLVARALDEAGVLRAEAKMQVEKAREELAELSTMAERVRAELRVTLTRYLDFLGGEPEPAAEPAAAQPQWSAAKAVEPMAAPATPVPAEAMAALEPAAETEEVQANGKGLDEQTLVELFQESAAKAGEPEHAPAAADTEDFADLFESMEIPDAATGEDESTIEELTTDMLFSEEPAGEEDSGPTLSIAEGNQDTPAKGRKQQSG